MSFTRAQYQTVFDFAVAAWRKSADGSDFEARCVHIMWMVEDVIGQQINFPPEARKDYPRGSFPSLPPIQEKRDE